MNICHIELVNPLTKHTLLVIGQIYDEFSTSRNILFKPSIKAMKIGPKTSEEKLFIKTGQITRQLPTDSYLSRFNESQQLLTDSYLSRSRQLWTDSYLSRITKISFSDLIFSPCLCVCVRFLFSQPEIYIKLILKAITYENTRRTHAKGD